MKRPHPLTLLILSCALALAIAVFQSCEKAGDTDTKSLQGRHYYLVEDGFTCLPQSGAESGVPSWRNQVYFDDGEVCETGTKCNDSYECRLTTNHSEIGIEFNGDKSEMYYQGQTYKYLEAPPY